MALRLDRITSTPSAAFTVYREIFPEILEEVYLDLATDVRDYDGPIVSDTHIRSETPDSGRAPPASSALGTVDEPGGVRHPISAS